MKPLHVHARLTRLRTEEAGQTLIEYAGLALLVSIAVIILLSAIGLDIAEGFDVIENTLGIGDPNTVPADPGVSDTATPSGVN
jgi:Flp pilus assembly pilin Flp